MELNFTNTSYKESALKMISIDYENSITSSDAFIVLLNGVDYETIDNLCKYVSSKFSLGNPRGVYSLIQSGDCASDFKKIILDSAYELIHQNKYLGNKIVEGKFNASSWIVHSLYEGEVASSLAVRMNLNPDTAMKLGILHDVGRKIDHTFMHTIKGYEYLYNLGLKDEAICCLTHSFLSVAVAGVKSGNRCANCDSALDGFYIDGNGNGVFRNSSIKDDMTLFLEKYQYNSYDMIINISDLMAMSSGIVSPYERVADVYTRREYDERNGPFFKICFVNSMNDILYKITNNNKYQKNYNINDFSSIDDINDLFMRTSDEFISTYNSFDKKGNISI